MAQITNDDIVITWSDVMGRVWIWIHCEKCGRGTSTTLRTSRTGSQPTTLSNASSSAVGASAVAPRAPA